LALDLKPIAQTEEICLLELKLTTDCDECVLAVTKDILVLELITKPKFEYRSQCFQYVCLYYSLFEIAGFACI